MTVLPRQPDAQCDFSRFLKYRAARHPAAQSCEWLWAPGTSKFSGERSIVLHPESKIRLFGARPLAGNRTEVWAGLLAFC
jgi:hypothetical protein